MTDTSLLSIESQQVASGSQPVYCILLLYPFMVILNICVHHAGSHEVFIVIAEEAMATQLLGTLEQPIHYRTHLVTAWGLALYGSSQ